MSLLAQNERLARRVGAITLLVLAGTIAFVVLVLDRIEIGARTRIRVFFAHSTGLRESAPLVVGGQAIGQIESIESVMHGGTNPLGGEIGTVATIAIAGDQAWKVPAKADVFVSSRGLLSERYLEVAPTSLDADPGEPVREGSELRGIDPPTLDTVLRRTWANMTIFKLFTDEVGPELAALRSAVTDMRTQVATIAADIEILVPLVSGVGPFTDEARALVAEARITHDEALGGETGIAAFAAMISRARQSVAQLRSVIDQLSPHAARIESDVGRVRGHIGATDPVGRASEVLVTARASLDKLDPLLATVEDLAGRLARHEGTLGRLMNDPEFPEDAKELGKILKRRPWRVIAKPID